MLTITESKTKPVWNVIYGNFNSGRIEVFNVFNHYSFAADCQKIAKKYKDDKEKFAEELKRSLMYFFWSKCEWEVIVSHWPPKDRDRDEKIDVYDQVILNWQSFLDYTWEHRKEIKVK